MLSINEVKEKQFEKAMGFGYRVDDVDKFVALFSTTLESVTMEKQQLEEQLDVLADKLEEYKKDENSFRTALVAAQKLADGILADSKQKSADIIKKAEFQSEEIIAKAQNKADQSTLEAKNKMKELHNKSMGFSDEILSQVKFQSESTIQSTKKICKEMVENAKNEAVLEKNKLIKLNKDVKHLKEELINLYNNSIQNLVNMPINENIANLDFEATYLKKLPDTDSFNVNNISVDDIMDFNLDLPKKNELEEIFVSELDLKIDIPEQFHQDNQSVDNTALNLEDDDMETDDFISIFKTSSLQKNQENEVNESVANQSNQEELKEKIKSKFIFISDDELDSEKNNKFSGKLEFGSDFSIKRKDKNNSKLF